MHKHFMGSGGKEKSSVTHKLRHLQVTDLPERSGTETPPLRPPVSVPFQWEEKPGKPRPCTALIILPTEPKCLDPPPRLLIESDTTKFTRPPSCSPSIEGPRVARPKFSSFRFFNTSPGRGELGDEVPGKKWQKVRVLLGSWGPKSPVWKVGRKEVDGGGSGDSPSSSCDSDKNANTNAKFGQMRSGKGFSSLPQTRSHLLAVAYEGLKQVIQWKNRKARKEELP